MQRLATEIKIELLPEIADKNIAESCACLLGNTHRATIEQYLFEAFGYLGYYKDYSDTAHKMLEQNNEMNREPENAPILRSLGDFYERKGSKGTEYYYNAFVLYIRRADNQIRYGFPDKARTELGSAKDVHLKFRKSVESELPKIEINRVSALLALEENDPKIAINTINDTFIKAAQNNIPVEKQCRIILAYGRIYRHLPETRPEALKKLTMGLNICENVGMFDSPALSRRYKSRFLKEIGKLHRSDCSFKYDRRRKDRVEEYTELRTQSESHLKSALSIEESEGMDDFEVGDTL
jgi:hypothetical protein